MRAAVLFSAGQIVLDVLMWQQEDELKSLTASERTEARKLLVPLVCHFSVASFDPSVSTCFVIFN